MISSNLSRANHPVRMRLVLNSTEGRQAGILMDSVVMADNLATIREIEIDRRLGALSEMKDVDTSLRHTLALS